MNILHIIDEIEKADNSIADRLSPRRQAMKDFYGFGSKVALASLPFALGSMFKKAYGRQTSSTVLNVLNFALTLEYLEAEFYTRAVERGTALIPAGAPTGAITTIRDHENQHVAFLRTAITQAGGTPVPKPTFDFSGGNGSGNGPFKEAFNNYGLFLAVAQTFEDTGVRAYKGQAGDLLGSGGVLEAALNIHSVEARHASHIRQMRRANGSLVPAGVVVKPWITENQSGIADSAVQPAYNGEEIKSQAGVGIQNINGQNISAAAASEAFDEPLTKDQVLAIVDPFIV
ncbi:dessication-associated protein [Pedobacter yulinensis]|uniref:Dessication-associated protein n=1 Tax=Pedobacter yulinensis TaxID=2126353 RepID=A0A2T3HI51_9SPHI|nr:ferritin-like domain-containing protein [Pedobacter yulinensis]PST82125.1 dessication-associated protein [Pedobacter yulinensis]